MKKMRHTKITDVFKAIKKEPNSEGEQLDSIAPDGYQTEINSEPRCYIKEETDIPIDEINSADSDHEFSTEECSTLNNSTCSIVITQNNELQSQEIIREPASYATANSNVENSIASNKPKQITESNDVKKKRRERNRKKGANQFYESLCPKCNKKSQAKYTITECDDCGVNLIYECIKCHKQLQTHLGISDHVRRQCFNQGFYFKCFKCDYKGSVKRYVTQHIRNNHADSIDGRYYDRIERIKSNKTQDDFSKYMNECTKCKKKFANFNNLIKHVQQCNGSQENGNESAIEESKSESVPLDSIAPEDHESSREECSISNNATSNRNIEISSATYKPKKITKSNGVKKKGKERNRKRGANQFYESLCPECNKKSQAKYTKTECDDCGVNLIYECLKCHKQLHTHMGITDHVKRQCFNQGFYFKCFQCDYKSSLKPYVTHHIRRHHPDSLVDRYYDRIEIINSNNTQDDVSRNIDECTKCKKKFENLNNLMKHVQQCNGSQENGNESAIEETNSESVPLDSIAPDEYRTKIKSEPRCYIKEETDIPMDEINNADSDHEFSSEEYSTLHNRTCSIAITQNNELQSEEITREPASYATVNSNIENLSASEKQKQIIESNGVKKKRKERNSKKGANRFYESLCPKCNKKSPAKFTKTKCDDCKVNFIYECIKCHKQLQSHVGISDHVKRQCFDQGCYYKCFKCDYKSSLKHYVSQHFRRTHPDSLVNRYYDRIERIESNNTQDDISKYMDECPKCEKKFGNLNNLMKHVQQCNGSQQNGNESAIKVEKESKQFSSDYKSTKNMLLRYCSKCDEEASVDVVGSCEGKLCIKCHTPMAYKCLTCEKIYNTCIGTVMHILSKHIEKPKWKCPKCEFKTVSLSYLSSHYRRMHNPKFYDCQKCNQRLKSQELLTRHMRRCGAARNLQCEHCFYKTCRRKYLIQHLYNVHSSENRSVVCEKCQGVYKDRRVLNTHLRLYCKKEASFRCDHCSYKAKRKYCIEQHIIRHHMTKQCKRECFKCKRIFKRQKPFEKHLISCNLEPHIQCTVCPYKAFKKKFLKVHMTLVHPMNSIKNKTQGINL